MFASLQNAVTLVISLAALLGAVWGLVDAARYSNGQFVGAGKRPKTTWLALLAGATLVAFLSLPAPLGRGGGVFGLLGIASIVVVAIYFTGVRPALQQQGPASRGGSSRNNRGGW